MTSRWGLAARWGLMAVSALGLGLGMLGASWGVFYTLLPAVVYAAIGWLLTRRKPENPIGWVFLGVGSVAGLIAAANAAMTLAVRSDQPSAWYALTAAWFSNFLWIVALTLGFVLTLLLFPHGLASPRWRPLLWTSVVTCALIVVEGALAPNLVVASHTYANPLHPGRWGQAAKVMWAASLTVMALCGVAAVVCMILRYVRSSGVERAQLRWLAYSAGVLLVFMFVPRVNGTDLGFAVVFSLLPVSCGIAILRYHLYDIDRIISRTTSYAVVTGLLLAVYGTIVLSASRLLHNDSPVVVAAATLSAAALARPALRRVQLMVDRRFDRARYDALQTIDDFGARLRHEVDPDVVVADLSAVVRRALQPEHSTITLVERS